MCNFSTANVVDLWNTVGDTNRTNHCYGVFRPSTPLNWYDAQLACNRLGGHLATVTTADEFTHLKTVLSNADGSTTRNYWVGLSNYEASTRWVGMEGDASLSTGVYDAVNLNAGVTGAAGDLFKCAVISKDTTSGSNGTVACSLTVGVDGYVCEQRPMQLVQPCVSGFWPIKGGRRCVQEDTSTGSPYAANILCATLQSVAAHLCTREELFEACGSGMNPFSAKSGTSTTLRRIPDSTHLVYGDRSADSRYYFTNDGGVCDGDNDGAPVDSDPTNYNVSSYSYRCCY